MAQPILTDPPAVRAGPPVRPVSVLVVVDRQPGRDNLRRTLARSRRLRVESSDVATALTLLPSQRPDVALVDVPVLPDRVAEVVAVLSRHVPVLAIGPADAAATEMLLTVGAVGHLWTPIPTPALVAALATAGSMPAMPAPRPVRLAADAPVLSERLLQVLHCVAEGMGNPQIAARLFVEVSTVKTHVHRLLRALGATDRAGSVGEAFRLGILR